MLKTFIDALMGGDANGLCDAIQVRAAIIGSTPVLVTRPGIGPRAATMQVAIPGCVPGPASRPVAVAAPAGRAGANHRGSNVLTPVQRRQCEALASSRGHQCCPLPVERLMAFGSPRKIVCHDQVRPGLDPSTGSGWARLHREPPQPAVGGRLRLFGSAPDYVQPCDLSIWAHLCYPAFCVDGRSSSLHIIVTLYVIGSIRRQGEADDRPLSIDSGGSARSLR
jgi:hypothetical protein